MNQTENTRKYKWLARGNTFNMFAIRNMEIKRHWNSLALQSERLSGRRQVAADAGERGWGRGDVSTTSHPNPHSNSLASVRAYALLANCRSCLLDIHTLICQFTLQHRPFLSAYVWFINPGFSWGVSIHAFHKRHIHRSTVLQSQPPLAGCPTPSKWSCSYFCVFLKYGFHIWD